MKSRIMYIENKSNSLTGGESRIGRVTFSKTGNTLYYQGRSFQSLKGNGFKSNYIDIDSGEHFWISGPKKNGEDGLYGGSASVIDDDVHEEYWREIRGMKKEDAEHAPPAGRGEAPRP